MDHQQLCLNRIRTDLLSYYGPGLAKMKITLDLTFNNSADAFIQSDVQIVYIECVAEDQGTKCMVVRVEERSH